MQEETEQYRSPEMAKLYRSLCFNQSLQYQSKLFEGLVESGALQPADPYVLALEFFSPVFLLFYKYDNDEQSLHEARALFMCHIRQFRKAFGQ